MSLAELAVKITSDVKGFIEGAEKVESRTAQMGDALVKVGLGATAAGAAMTAMGKAVEPLNQSLDRAAVLTGENADDLRTLALEMTNVTFPLSQVTAGMERLSQSGITTKEEMAKILPVMDAFADATGGDVVGAIEIFDSVSSALGIPLTEMEEHLDTLTFLSANTTVGMDALAKLMRREAPAMKDMGLSVEDVAIAMAALEAEGIKGPAAVLGFQEAIKNADGSMEEFWKQLGVANETLVTQQERLAGSAGLTAELGEINTRSLTVWDSVKQRISETAFANGELLEKGGHVGQMMVGLGPIVAGVGKTMQMMTSSTLAQTVATKALTIAKTLGATAANAFGVAVRFALGPLGLIVTAIGLAVAAGVYLYKNWDEVADKVTAIWERIKGAIKSPVNSILGYINAVIGGAEAMVNAMGSAVNRIPSFDVPSWVPGIGGQKFGLPNIPTVNLPRIPLMDTGGLVKGPGVFQVGAGVTEVVRRYDGGSPGITVNVTGPIYGVLDFEQKVTQTVRDAIQGGGFRGVIATP